MRWFGGGLGCVGVFQRTLFYCLLDNRVLHFYDLPEVKRLFFSVYFIDYF